MPFDMMTDIQLNASTENSPVRSDEAVQEARDRDGVVEAYELADNDDGYHCVIITEHPLPAEREGIEEGIDEIEDDPKASHEDLEAYLDQKREEAEAASDALYEELQGLPSIVSEESRRFVGRIHRDEPVHEIAWSPGHPGGHEDHHGLAER